MNKLLIIDGNSIAYRAFYALPLLHNGKGMYTNAVYGFTTMLLKMLEAEKPSHVLVAFDAGKVTFRHNEFEAYKGKREKTPSELSGQFPIIRQLLEAFSIKHYELENYEADDIIGTLTQEAELEKWAVKVVTGDKDMLQLVSEHIHVALTRKGISEIDAYDLAKLDEVYQLRPEQIIDLKGLMGDPSDNIPGVPGVGEKTALKLLHQFGSIEQVYEHIEQVSGKKLTENLITNKEQAFLSKSLATINRQAPLTISLADSSYQGFDPQKLLPLFKELNFDSLIDRLGIQEEEQAGVEEISVQVIQDSLDPLLTEILTSPSALQVEIIQENYHRAPLLGFSVVNEHGLFFIPTEVALDSTFFLQWLADPEQQKWVHDSKRIQVALAWQGLELAGVSFDSYLAAYLLNPTESIYTLETLAKQYANLQLFSDEQVYGKGAKRKVPEERTTLSRIL